MSTTLVSHISSEPGTDMYWGDWIVVTVKEDDAKAKMEKALRKVQPEDVTDDDGNTDEIELRASISSELKRQGLQLIELRVCELAFLGTD